MLIIQAALFPSCLTLWFYGCQQKRIKLQSPAEVWSILYISDGRNEIIPQRFDLLLTGVTPLFAAAAFTPLSASYILRNFIENLVSVETFLLEFMVLYIFQSKIMGIKHASLGSNFWLTKPFIGTWNFPSLWGKGTTSLSGGPNRRLEHIVRLASTHCTGTKVLKRSWTLLHEGPSPRESLLYVCTFQTTVQTTHPLCSP